MTIICSYLSVRDRVAEWIKNKTPLIYIQQTYSNLKDTLAKTEKIEKDIPSKWQTKKAEVAILSDNRDFKPITVTRDKEGHYII